MEYKLKNLEDLETFSKALARLFKEGDVVSLVGDLGAGKTTMVQYICKELGVSEYVTSPTFSIVNLYAGDFEIYHLDLYRIESPRELESMDYERYFYPDGISFIEWAEKGGDYLPEEMIEIFIEYDGDGRRVFINRNTSRGKYIGERLDENFSS